MKYFCCKDSDFFYFATKTRCFLALFSDSHFFDERVNVKRGRTSQSDPFLFTIKLLTKTISLKLCISIINECLFFLN